MRDLKQKSLDELYDLELELSEQTDEEQYGRLSNLVRLYKEMHQRLIRLKDKDPEQYEFAFQRTEEQLVFYLVRFGTYMKMENQKDDYIAKNSLEQALRYDRKNPEAHYRLGFLAYKKESYMEALQYLQKALQYQEVCGSKKYRLNNQQMYYAHQYSAQSALHIAEAAQHSLAAFPAFVNTSGATHYKLAPLQDVINQNEANLQRAAFTIITPNGTEGCSKNKCEDIAESKLKNTIILYFSERQTSLIYNGREQVLRPDYAEILRYFLLFSSEAVPVIKWDFYDLLKTAAVSGEVPNNTYTQRVGRLKRKLAEYGIPPVIENKARNGQTGYYFNHILPYTIMHRTDDTFILNG